MESYEGTPVEVPNKPASLLPKKYRSNTAFDVLSISGALAAAPTHPPSTTTWRTIDDKYLFMPLLKVCFAQHVNHKIHNSDAFCMFASNFPRFF